MKVLIVEDENLLAKQLAKLTSALEPSAELVGRTTSITTTIQWLNEHETPDLILMDIELADGQCFEIFQKVVVKTPIIFTTAYDEYAIQAFKVNSIDYLLKPIKEEELKIALHKFKEVRNYSAGQSASPDFYSLINQLKQTQTKDYKDRFLVKTGQKMLSINTDEIAFFYSKNSLSFIITKDNQKFAIEHTLDEVEKSINAKHFFRANRQYILSHDTITTALPWFNGKLIVNTRHKSEENIVISRDKAPLFKTWLGE